MLDNERKTEGAWQEKAVKEEEEDEDVAFSLVNAPFEVFDRP